MKEIKKEGGVLQTPPTKPNQHTKSIPQLDEYQGEIKTPLDFKQELELLRGFPLKVQKEILRNKITEINQKLKEYKKILRRKIHYIRNEIPKSEHIVYIAFLNLLHKTEIAPLLKRKQRLLMLRQSINPKKQQDFLDWELLKENAKQTNIIDVATQLGIKVIKKGKYYTALCPFHSDRNPSFYLYPDSNTFYCFGCGEHGDVIDLRMKLAGEDFKTAV